MSGLDIEAIRARYEHAMTATKNRLAVAACASAEDVPKLLAEIERLHAELNDSRFGLIGERDDALQVIADLRGGTT